MPEYIHVSVAWPYANGDLHIGHLAGAYLSPDIFARYHRLKGNYVLMVSGSDSHGTPISVEADKRGIPARQLFEHYHERFLLTQKKMGISYNLFTHTDTENHHRVAQDFFLLLLERGFLYKEKQELLYSEAEHRFLPDRYVEGQCYICHYDQARGDQCDNCGNLLDATKLINPRSKSNPKDQLIIRETEHYFLDLSQFTDQLLPYIEAHKNEWRPNVTTFAQNIIMDGLHGRPITRDIEWGIPVPLTGWGSKSLYVWFEAVIGYISASIEWAVNSGRPDEWKSWWYNPKVKIYNFLGKDNIPFHTIIWQAQLIGVNGIYSDNNIPIQLPYNVPANEFMNIEGKQFSKSRNWAIWLPDILERYQVDAIRYYVAATLPETGDSDFSWEAFLHRVNDELLAAWGNLSNRILTFAYVNFNGVVPEYDELKTADIEILEKVKAGFQEVGSLIEQVKLREALNRAMILVRAANAYLDHQAPWKTIKQDRIATARSVYTTLCLVDNLKTILAPFMPFSSQQLHEFLGYNDQLFGNLDIVEYHEKTRTHKALVYSDIKATGSWKESNLQSGQQLRKPSPLFIKIEPEMVEYERSRLGKLYQECLIDSD